MTKIALGTVQFGLNYGISNQKGKITDKEVSEILKLALTNGIDTLDTAQKYGDSEEKIGKALVKTPYPFKIISKLDPECKLHIEDSYLRTLEKLGLYKLYGFLIHDFNILKEDNKIWNSFLQLKKQGRVDKIGVSLYYPEELEYLLNNHIDVDLVQLPYSIFDRRFENYFRNLSDNNIELHVRSVFLQGLVFIDPMNLQDKFLKIKTKITHLNNLSKIYEIPISAICLNFALLNNSIDRVIIGIESVKNLEANILAQKFGNKVSKIYNQLLSFREDDERIILPSNWENS